MSSGKVYPTSDAAIEAAGKAITHGALVAKWNYVDAADNLQMCVARFNCPDGSKEFRPVHQRPDGWHVGDPPGLLPLYDLPHVAAKQLVFVAEGEQCADALRAIGLPATTSAHGAQSAVKTDWSPLANKVVVIFTDNDDAGRKYGRDVGKILTKLGCLLKIVALPDLGPGEDIADWIARCGEIGPAAIREKLTSFIDPHPHVEPSLLVGGPVTISFKDVVAQPINWLWYGRIALGTITLLVGRPGEGKSFLTLFMAATVSNGGPWPDGRGNAPGGPVLFITSEDDPAYTIRPRLDSHFANVSKVHLLKFVRHVNDDGEVSERVFTLPDLRSLEEAIDRVKPILVVIDPIGSFLGGDADAHRDNEVRSVLAPVARLAEKYGSAVLIVAHRRKAGGEFADDLALGSRAFTGIARAVWHLSRDPDDKSRRLLLPGKNNLCVEGDGLAFTIAGDPPALIWEREPVQRSADEQLIAEEGDDHRPGGPAPEARNTAAEWLQHLLSAGEIEVAKIREQSEEAGLAWRTVQRAADQLSVLRERNNFNRTWQWRLPRPGADGAH